MRKHLLALALTSLAFSTAASADNGRGTPEEQKACTRDVEKHCRAVIDQGDFTVLACLKENRAKISTACNQVLKNHGQ
jgi:Cysteine rich repeat